MGTVSGWFGGRLARDLFHKNGVETWGELNLLKCGAVFADRIVAVSPTYAKEIQTPAFGVGLDGLLRHRSSHLFGILNGVETSECPNRTLFTSASGSTPTMRPSRSARR